MADREKKQCGNQQKILIMKAKIINRSGYALPSYETAFSAGMDLRAGIKEEITLNAGERMLMPTGLFIELPQGYEAQIRPRSGLAVKAGVTVLNSPGTIDADYRGEICVILINLSAEAFRIKPGDRIAQMVVAKHERVEWQETDELESSVRGSGGFGSTGR